MPGAELPCDTGLMKTQAWRSCFSDAYWLAHCGGFYVDAPGGRVGLVEEVVSGDDGEPLWLAVRSGQAGWRILVVPVEQIVEIDSRAERVLLRQWPPVAARYADDRRRRLAA